MLKSADPQLVLSHSNEFVENAIKIRRVRNQISSFWKRISSGLLELVEGIDILEKEDGSFDFDLRQRNILGHPVESLDELYEAAALANAVFSAILMEVVEALSLNPEYLKLCSLKGRPRALEKAKDDYDEREPGHGERWLFDISRAALLCESEKEIADIINYLRTSPAVTVVRLKNRFANPTPTGFRDVNLNIQVRLNGSCELQIHSRPLKVMCVELGSHGFYEYFRSYFRGGTRTIQYRLDLLDELFGGVDEGDTGSTICEGERTPTLSEIVEGAITTANKAKLSSLRNLLEVLVEQELGLVVRRKLLQIDEAEFGAEHFETVVRMNDLGILLEELNDFDGARLMYERALEVFERTLGPDHLDTLRTVGNLATLMVCLDHKDQARALYERALTGTESIVGGDNISTLFLMNNLACLLKSMDDLDGARSLLEKVVAGKEKQFGADHPETLLSVCNLANLLNKTNDFVGALQLYERTLTGQEKTRGPEHTETLRTMNNLAGLLMQMGNFERSRSLLESALLITKKIHGAEHSETANVLANLARLHSDMNDVDTALSLGEQAMTIRERSLGLGHAMTIEVTTFVAVELSKSGNLERSHQVYEKLLHTCELKFGPDDIETLHIMYNLAGVLTNSRQFERARELYNRSLSGHEAIYGPNHQATMVVVVGLAFLCMASGDGAGARSLYERALSTYETTLGSDHYETVRVMVILGSLLKRMGAFKEAKELLDRALPLMQEHPLFGPQHSATVEVVDTIPALQLCLAVLDSADSLSVKVTHPSHPHELTKQPFIYGGQYGCDVCTRQGLAWVYHCEQCGFDAHPQCVL